MNYTKSYQYNLSVNKPRVKIQKLDINYEKPCRFSVFNFFEGSVIDSV